jgi:hypothetical protein
VLQHPGGQDVLLENAGMETGVVNAWALGWGRATPLTQFGACTCNPFSLNLGEQYCIHVFT